MAQDDTTSFKDLGLIEELCEACERVGWKAPTKIQREAIPLALAGHDVVGLAETGSGKTGAFGLPLLQALLLEEQPSRRHNFGLILTPTRELAVQIKEQFDDLGSEFGLKCVAVVGGMDMAQQAIMLLQGRGPHIIVATLGRIADHIKHLKGFNLSNVKYLVMDEADRILSMDYQKELDAVIRSLPRERTTMLFSATITNKVKELQAAHLKDAVKVEVHSSFSVVEALTQYVLPVVFVEKHAMLLLLLERVIGQKSAIVFCNSRASTMRTALMLARCGHTVIPLSGDMDQTKRLAALQSFRKQERSVLVATDVASRGLDVRCVDWVINMEVPGKTEDYIHRVGRTARVGRPGTAITMVSQFEREEFLVIETQLKTRMNKFDVAAEDVAKYGDKCAAAEKSARADWKRIEAKRRARNRGGCSDSEEDTEDASGVRRHLKKAARERAGGGRGSKSGGGKMRTQKRRRK